MSETASNLMRRLMDAQDVILGMKEAWVKYGEDSDGQGFDDYMEGALDRNDMFRNSELTPVGPAVDYEALLAKYLRSVKRWAPKGDLAKFRRAILDYGTFTPAELAELRRLAEAE